VAVTVTTIGVGTYAFVDARLRDGLLDEADRQAQFNLSVLLPERLPGEISPESYDASGLREAFRLRGDVETIVDFGHGIVDVSNTDLLDALGTFPASLTSVAASGRLGYAWLDVAGTPSLVVGGRQGASPVFYFVFPARTIESALEQLRLGLLVAAIIAILLALATARLVARGILRPVDSGSAAAARIAAGDLSARLPAGGADEFARFASEFNRMADSLASSVEQLRASEGQNRRFVSDVSHELRTPLTALVAEASVIERGLDGLSPDARRAAELLVADVRRLRTLVEDLMELSRFDARAEQADLHPTELGETVRSIVAARRPGAVVDAPEEPIVVAADVRRLDRIVGNLLDNAAQHAAGSQIEVQVRAGEAGATVAVKDRGPGVPPDVLDHLFERFYKADASRHQGSSGLGLAIAAEHAALLGGALSARNREGGGLEVTLSLPRTGVDSGSLPAGDGLDTEGSDAPTVSGVGTAPTDQARPNA
jgi:signal transduction histidine kinase